VTVLHPKRAMILLIEDNPINRVIMKKALTAEGYEVLEAAHGEEALVLLKNSPPLDLILVDLSMPQMNGKEFIQRFRENAKSSGTKIILVSGWEPLAETARALGVDGYLRKPVDLDDLYREIQRHLPGPALPSSL